MKSQLLFGVLVLLVASVSSRVLDDVAASALPPPGPTSVIKSNILSKN
jgi:hypothetical protein